MKKSLIIVAVIAIAILAGFIILGDSKSGVIKSNLDDARMKAKQAGLKAFVSATMVDMLTYYQDPKNTTPYNDNPTVKQNLETKLAVLKQKNDGQYEYRIYDDPNGDASVKAGELSSGIYVCTDTKDVKVVDITKDSFEQATNCSGGPLK